MDTIDRKDAYTVASLADLAKIYAKPLPNVASKETDHITEVGRTFIAASPFLVLATSNGSSIDCSPKGDAPGFVHVLDDHRLAIPDATGNRRLDGLQNMIENPHVGLVFLIPGLGETLRVNGTVELTRDPALLEGLETGGKPPALALVVSAEQVYLHCAKCVIRSNLWKPESWPESLPSAAAILSDHIGIGDVEASAAALADSYANHI